MGFGLFQKSLWFHQWMARRGHMKVFVAPEWAIPTARMSYDDATTPAMGLYDPYDYSRWRTVELIREQIGDLPGMVAEAGVYQGDFARLLNHCFPDRTLFLYDTFEGNDERDLSHDAEKGLIDEGFAERWSYFKEVAPIIEEIKQKMPHPEQCVFRKGYFPETIGPEEEKEKFVFVSIDIMLYKPTYAALEFFYPRLQEGGAIFVRAYNMPCCLWQAGANAEESPAKRACLDAEKRFGPFKKLPLPNNDGTLVILK